MLVIGVLLALAFLSAVLSAASWSGTRRNNDIRAIGRRTF